MRVGCDPFVNGYGCLVSGTPAKSGLRVLFSYMTCGCAEFVSNAFCGNDLEPSLSIGAFVVKIPSFRAS